MTMTQDEISFQNVCREFVDKNVYYLVSPLIKHLMDCEPDNHELAELAYTKDYQSPAEELGWTLTKVDSFYVFTNAKTWEGFVSPMSAIESEDVVWENLCFSEKLEPYIRESLEFWLVSEPLAKRLAAKGEAVADIYSLDVWGRTTTGQAIHMDSVIKDIVRDVESDVSKAVS